MARATLAGKSERKGGREGGRQFDNIAIRVRKSERMNTILLQ